MVKRASAATAGAMISDNKPTASALRLITRLPGLNIDDYPVKWSPVAAPSGPDVQCQAHAARGNLFNSCRVGCCGEKDVAVRPAAGIAHAVVVVAWDRRDRRRVEDRGRRER